MDGYPFSIGIIVPESERQEIKVDISNKALDKTLVMEAIQKEVPGRLRWKKYPLCTKNLTGSFTVMFMFSFNIGIHDTDTILILWHNTVDSKRHPLISQTR